MKNIIIVFLFFLICFQYACSMGSKKYDQPRDISKTFFWGSKDVGIFITQTCRKYEKEICQDWIIKSLNANNKDDWNFIVNNNMILVNENIFFETDK
jgi:hypothetical protein